MFTFRKAKPEDKSRVLEISSKIWDGDDYIPEVFEEWVKEENGEFTIAEYEGKIAGLAKYTKLIQNEAWLEGIRADKAYAGKGFADEMTKYYIGKAEQEGLDALRLSTFIENYQSIHVIEKNGFKKDGYFSYGFKQVEKISEARAQKNVIPVMSTATAWSFIEQSAFYKKSNGYISNGWRFYKLSYELLDRLVKQGSVLGMLKDGGIKAMAIVWGDMNAETTISLSYIEGDMLEKNRLLEHIEHLAKNSVVQTIEFMSVLDSDLIDLALDREFEFVYENPKAVNVFVYIKNI